MTLILLGVLLAFICVVYLIWDSRSGDRWQNWRLYDDAHRRMPFLFETGQYYRALNRFLWIATGVVGLCLIVAGIITEVT